MRVIAHFCLCYAFRSMASLDSSQRAFVEAPEEHIRLLAPAGCGKTRSLLDRCAHLLNSTVFASYFLIVTFTKPAQKELEARVSSDPSYAALKTRTTIRTLNAWGWQRFSRTTPKPRLLSRPRERKVAAEEHLQPLWRQHEAILRSLDSRLLSVNQIVTLVDELKSLGFIHARHNDFQAFSDHLAILERFRMPPYVREKIVKPLQLAKLIDEEASAEEQKLQLFNSFYKFWLEAAPALPTHGSFTFEDQKYFAYLGETQLLPDGLQMTPPRHYDHILVDEFEDINPLDLGLISAIRERTNAVLTIVGDDDQAIYEWRGGTPEYILDPSSAFGVPFDTKTLEVNYRSAANIIERSQKLISHNERRQSKTIRAAASAPVDAKIEVIRPRNENDAMEWMDLLIGRCSCRRDTTKSNSRIDATAKAVDFTTAALRPERNPRCRRTRSTIVRRARLGDKCLTCCGSSPNVTR